MPQALFIQNDDRINLIKSGEKYATARLGDRDFEVGEKLVLYNHEIQWVAETKVVDVKHCKIEDLTQEDIQAQGYRTRTAFMAVMEKVYPNVALNNRVTLVEWGELEFSEPYRIDRHC